MPSSYDRSVIQLFIYLPFPLLLMCFTDKPAAPHREAGWGPGKDSCSVTKETWGQIPWQAFYPELSGSPSTICKMGGKSLEPGWPVLKREGCNHLKNLALCLADRECWMIPLKERRLRQRNNKVKEFLEKCASLYSSQQRALSCP